MSGLVDLTEKEWSDQLVGTEGKPGLARTLGWRTCYHTLRSKGSTSGFPDWVLVRERVIFLELKTEKGRVSETQAAWIKALIGAMAEVYVVRPSHLEEIGAVLQRRSIPSVTAYALLPKLYAERQAILARW